MFRRFHELGLYKKTTQHTVTYSENPEGEMDVERALKQEKRIWKTTQPLPANSQLKKTLIICDWSFENYQDHQREPREIITNKIAILEELYLYGFTLYVWQNKHMEKVTQLIDIKKWIRQTQPTHPNEIKRALNQYNLTQDETKLIDYFTLNKLLENNAALDDYQLIDLNDLENTRNNPKKLNKIFDSIAGNKIGFDNKNTGDDDTFFVDAYINHSNENIVYINSDKQLADSLESLEQIRPMRYYNVELTGANKIPKNIDYMIYEDDLNEDDFHEININSLVGLEIIAQKYHYHHPRLTQQVSNELDSAFSFYVPPEEDNEIRTDKTHNLLLKKNHHLSFLKIDAREFTVRAGVPLKALKHLELIANVDSTDEIIALIDQQERLESLTLHIATNISISKKLNRTTKLKTFSIGRSDDILDADDLRLTAEIIKNSPHLQAMTLIGLPDEDITSEILLETLYQLSKCRQLEELHLQLWGDNPGYHLIDEKFSTENDFTHLKKLKLSFEQLNLTSVKRLLKKTTKLVYLEIQADKIIDDDPGMPFPSLPDLKTFIFKSNIHPEADKKLNAFLSATPNLSSLHITLDIYGSRDMDKDTCFNFYFSGKRLERLLFSETSFLSNITLVSNEKLQELELKGPINFQTNYKKIESLTLSHFTIDREINISPRVLHIHNVNISNALKASSCLNLAEELTLTGVSDGTNTNTSNWSYHTLSINVENFIASFSKLDTLSIFENNIETEFFDFLIRKNLKKLRIHKAEFNEINPLCLLSNKHTNMDFKNIRANEKNKGQLTAFQLANKNRISLKECYYYTTSPEDLNTITPSTNRFIDSNTKLNDKTFFVREYFKKKKNTAYPAPYHYRLSVSGKLRITDENKGKIFAPLLEPEFQESDEAVLITDSLASDLENNYDQNFEDQKDYYFCRYPVQITPDKLYPLPSLSSNENIINMTTSTPLMLRYSQKTNLYYVYLPKEQQDTEATVEFILKVEHHPLLLNPVEHKQLKRLVDLFKSFTDGELQGINSETSDLDKLILMRNQRKGACRHRVYIALYIQSEFDFPIRGNFNDCHAFIEVMINNIWHFVDLGGYPAKLQTRKFDHDKIEKAQLDQFYAEVELAIKKDELELIESNSMEIEAAEKEAEENPFLKENTPDNNSIANIVSSIFSQSLNNDTPNILIVYDQLGFIEAFNLEMMTRTKAQQRNYYYVNHLDDINSDDVLITDNGTYEKITNELINKILHANKGDVFVFNWTDSRSDHIGHNSIISDVRMLNDDAIKKGVIIVSLVQAKFHNELREDFNSRHCAILKVAGSGNYSSESHTEEMLDAMDIDCRSEQVDLFHTDDWESKLLGKIEIKRGRIIEIKGALISALENKCDELKIINAPQESLTLRLFLQKIMVERGFRYHGKFYRVPDGFKITSLLMDSFEKLTYTPVGDFSSNDEAYILNAQTWFHFVTSYRMHAKTGWPETEAGILEKNQGKSIILFVDDNLALESWVKISQLSKKFQVDLKIIIGPKGALPVEMAALPAVTFAPQKTLTSALTYIKTNDIDYVVDWLESNASYDTYHVTAYTYADLVDTIRKDENDTEFSYIVGPVLSAIRNNQSIILKGHFSPKLLQQLESLTLPKPYLWVNGDKYYLPATVKITLVSEENNPFSLYSDVLEINPSFEMLIEQLSNLHSKHNTNNTEQLKLVGKNKSYSYIQLLTMLQNMNHHSFKHIENLDKPFLLLDPNAAKIIAPNLPPKTKPTLTTEEFVAKRTKKIMKYLDSTHYVFVAGATGVGKSSFILSSIPDSHLFVGINELKAWLTSIDTRKKYLFIDEANLESEAIFELLEGVFGSKRGIILNGEFHPLTASHFIIFAGNLSNYADRAYHSFFKRHGNVIQFKDFPDNYLIEKIIHPILNICSDLPADDRNIATCKLLQAYKIIKKESTELTITARDLRMLCLRFLYIYDNKIKKAEYENERNSDALYDWIFFETKPDIHEFICTTISEHVKWMPNYGNLLPALKVLGVLAIDYDQLQHVDFNYVLTPSRQHIYHFLNDLFNLRNYLSTKNSNQPIQGILLEGPSGVGKSKIIDSFLANLKQQRDININYYHLTPKSKSNMLKMIHKAFHEGAILVIDEINSLDLEMELNQFKSGVDLQGNPATHPGFMVIGTQNPSSFPGRKKLSPAFLNRFQSLAVPEYPREELIDILTNKGVPPEAAHKMTDLYLKAKQLDNDFRLAPRTLFNYADAWLMQIKHASGANERKRKHEPDEIAETYKSMRLHPSTL